MSRGPNYLNGGLNYVGLGTEHSRQSVMSEVVQERARCAVARRALSRQDYADLLELLGLTPTAIVKK